MNKVNQSKLCYLVILLVSLISAGTISANEITSKKNNSTFTLTGKTVKHKWEKGAFAGAEFTTYICDDGSLVWNQTRYPDAFGGEFISPPFSSKEHYVSADIFKGLKQITWRENGANFGVQSVSWTLNEKSGEIFGVLVFEGDFGFGLDINNAPLDEEGNRQSITVSGTFEFIEGINEMAGFGTCD